jgi:molybdenum cofactor cytidylyltransferase
MTLFANLGAIMLAAGFSRRMGGENKLLQSVDGKPLICHALATVSSLGLRQLVVVLGSSADAVAPLVPARATVTRSPRAAGAAALDPALAGCFVVLSDMPFVAQGDYEKLATAFAGQRGGAICIPFHDGRRGQPVLFPARHFPDLAAAEGDSGPRHLFTDPAATVCQVDGCSAGILADFDDPAAFAAHARNSR